MGMRQRRCPECGKSRPYNEGQSPHDAFRRRENWFVLGEGIDLKVICKHCVKRIGFKQQVKPYN